MNHRSDRAERERALWLRAQDILWSVWDPIGVKGAGSAEEPWPTDEYHGYGGGVVRLLLEGVGPGELAEHLRIQEREQMGLEVHGTVDQTVEALVLAAGRLGFEPYDRSTPHPPGSPKERFELASRAIGRGDLTRLQGLLAGAPELLQATSRDGFRAPLLHYVAANGVPDELQRTPANAVEVCRALLAAGAEPDAVAGRIGAGEDATALCLLVSSWHPFEAGVQADLVRALVEGGARVDGRNGDGAPLAHALVFGYTRAAEELRALGARIDNLFFQAGLGAVEAVRDGLDSDRTPAQLCGTYRPVVPARAPTDRPSVIQHALLFAVTHERWSVAELLLEHGADPNGQTTGHHARLPLTQALFVRSFVMANWLVQAGADPDRRDGKLRKTAREMARECGRPGGFDWA